MKISWTGIKISIAGAKLSHLVLKDKIWDYGSMTEQVKMVFMQIEKTRKKGQPEFVRKFMTIKGYEFFKSQTSNGANQTEKILSDVSIINVKIRNQHLPDRFYALLNGSTKRMYNPVNTGDRRKISESFSEQWLFLRQGDWWLLDEMK
jgi:hypothetical protein